MGLLNAVQVFFFLAVLFSRSTTSAQSTDDQNGDDALVSNNDMMGVWRGKVRAATFDSSVEVPTVSRSQVLGGWETFGLTASAMTAPPFENAFSPLNIVQTQLSKWGISRATVRNLPTYSSMTHVSVVAKVFLSDDTASTAITLSKQSSGASMEVSAIIGAASRIIIGNHLLSQITTLCEAQGTDCPAVTSSPGLSSFWSSPTLRSISNAGNGVVYAGDIRNRRASGRAGTVVGHAFFWNVSLSLDMVSAISSQHIQTPAALAQVVADAFSDSEAVQSAFRTAANAVVKNGYLNVKNKRTQAKSLFTKVVQRSTVLASGVGNVGYAWVTAKIPARKQPPPPPPPASKSLRERKKE
jgi:hypothetical protein